MSLFMDRLYLSPYDFRISYREGGPEEEETTIVDEEGGRAEDVSALNQEGL